MLYKRYYHNILAAADKGNTTIILNKISYNCKIENVASEPLHLNELPKIHKFSSDDSPCNTSQIPLKHNFRLVW